MPYNLTLANRIREYLAANTSLKIEEKEMFRGLTFMINDKMCVCVSNNNLMCRYNPNLQDEVAEKKGYMPMIMKGKEYRGYGYISEEGYKTKKDFEYWVGLCLDFNAIAKQSKKKSK